jgi:hypothetical protein
MRFSKELRKEIYLYVYTILKTAKEGDFHFYSPYICCIINEFLVDNNYFSNTDVFLIEDFPELLTQRPKHINSPDSVWWCRKDYSDNWIIPRIKALEKCFELLKLAHE